MSHPVIDRTKEGTRWEEINVRLRVLRHAR